MNKHKYTHKLNNILLIKWVYEVLKIQEYKNKYHWDFSLNKYNDDKYNKLYLVVINLCIFPKDLFNKSK